MAADYIGVDNIVDYLSLPHNFQRIKISKGKDVLLYLDDNDKEELINKFINWASKIDSANFQKYIIELYGNRQKDFNEPMPKSFAKADIQIYATNSNMIGNIAKIQDTRSQNDNTDKYLQSAIYANKLEHTIEMLEDRLEQIENAEPKKDIVDKIMGFVETNPNILGMALSHLFGQKNLALGNTGTTTDTDINILIDKMLILEPDFKSQLLLLYNLRQNNEAMYNMALNTLKNN